MPKRMGRPPKGEQPRTEELTIRLSEKEAQKIQECATMMGITRTDALMAGIDLLAAECGKKQKQPATMKAADCSCLLHTEEVMDILYHFLWKKSRRKT